MSNKAIELFIRMHLEKTPTLQRGRQILTGDVIMGVLGAIQHQQPLGCDLIMARWLDDGQALTRIDAYIKGWAASSERPDLMYLVGILALSIFCGRPTADQERKLVSLWKRFSEQGHRSQRLIKRYQTKIDFVQNTLSSTEFRDAQIRREVQQYEALIDKEKQRLEAWAKKQATLSYQCPKCGGSGNSSVGMPCNECDGIGGFKPNADNVKKHLRKTGIDMVSEKVWLREVKPMFDAFLSKLHQEHDETARILASRLGQERAA